MDGTHTVLQSGWSVWAHLSIREIQYFRFFCLGDSRFLYEIHAGASPYTTFHPWISSRRV